MHGHHFVFVVPPSVHGGRDPPYGWVAMRSFVQFVRGNAPRQAHVDLSGLKDDELGRRGFAGRQAQLYRKNDPTQFEAKGDIRLRRAITKTVETPDTNDPRGRALFLLENDHCRIGVSRRTAPMPFYVRNLLGDEVHFVHAGTGRFETEFGTIPYEPGDYVVIPKAVTYRIVPDEGEQFRLLLETTSELLVPDYGPLGRHAPFDPTVVFVPEARVIDDPRPWEIVLLRGAESSSIEYPHDPCDVAAWKGDLFPFKLNIRDWNVVASDTLHLPPSVHQFLGATGVVLCTFLPHPAPGRVGAERTPWYHRNADFDEVTFVHGGNFFGIPLKKTLLEHAPQGVHHGAPEAARVMARATHDKVTRLEWQIVCIETEKPLRPTPALRALTDGAG